jgi:N-acetylated-alpha-linked acidic dipeptidase
MSLKLSLVSSAALLAGAAPAFAAPMIGFSPAGAQAERATEAKFDAVLSADAMRDRLKLMSSEPNQVGSPHDKANAEYTLAQYKAWGWDAHIETFSVLYPTPKEEKLELGGDHPFVATLTEPAIEGDSTSAHQQGGLPAYFAYGGEGDVNAPLIYVNYGMPADYDALKRLGLDVKGKIVIARYGAGWRGLKPKLAQEHGAVGCIVFSDPADDGYGTNDAYPKGPARPERGLQRGSVQDLPVEPGDPLTPGYGAVEGAPRIARADAKTILHIPAVPISWGDAQVFLRALGGPVAPKGWRGALPITYHVGGGPEAPTHLVVFSNWNQAPLYDVVATIKGAREPDKWVVRGNHRDGWVFGAEDPLSGQIAEMEEAKAIGALVKTGWRPDRTIIYTSWDGEEPGLLGSTEWAETHAKELREHAVAYINTDGSGRGLLSAEASYSLRSLVDNVAADVRDPESGASVRDRARAAIQVEALAPGASAELKADAKLAAGDGDLPLGNLGSGSDYTPFVQHLGVASINLGYAGEGQSGGVYHSAYDTFEHFSRFGDPGFVYSVVLAETAGRLVLRAADAEVAPFRFGDLASSVAAQTDELKKLVTTERETAAATDKLLDSQAFHLAADPTISNGPPDRLEPVPTIDFAPLDAAVAKLTASAAAYDTASKSDVGPAAAARADTVLQGVEQTLIDPRGLPGRPWYRHMIYAPGLLTGYGAKTLPGVREAIESRRWAEASEMIGRTAAILDAASARIDQATAALK